MKNYKYIRIILILIPIIALFYLFNKQFPLNGKLDIFYDFKTENAFIGSLNPKGRLSDIQKDNGDYFQIMVNDPVYFDLELPANYNKATVELKYKSENQDIIEIGGLASKDVWNFQVQPVQNLIIDEIAKSWHKIEKDGVLFLQKEPKYDSVDSFLENLPKIDEIAVFNYNLPYKYIHPNYKSRAGVPCEETPAERLDYEKKDEFLEISHKLKGKHSFYTYLGDNEDFNFIFELFDINEHQGSDISQIEVYYGSELIKKLSVTDDGIVGQNKKITDLGEWELNFSGDAGVYKVNLLLTDDILINKIKTKQSLVAFTDRLNFYGQNEDQEVINIFSNSLLVKFATSHVSGLQTVKIDGEEVAVEELNFEYRKDVKQDYLVPAPQSSAGWRRDCGGASEKLESFSRDCDVVPEWVGARRKGYPIEIPKGNILISGDALFSFSKEYFFDPRVRVLNRKENLDGVNYVITNYEPSLELDNWRVGRAVLDLGGLYKNKNKVKFMISAPNLDKNKGQVKISEIKILLETKPFILKVFNRLFR